MHGYHKKNVGEMVVVVEVVLVDVMHGRVIEDHYHRSSRTTPSSSDTSSTTSSTTSDGQSTLARGYADILRDVEGSGRGKRKPLDMDSLRQLEDKVGIAMAEYVGLLNGGQSSFVGGGERNNESTSSRGRELAVLSDLHDPRCPIVG
jgi:hypothetical protein